MTSNLIEYISNFISLEKTEIDAISAVIQIKDYKKGQILLKEGMVAQISYFNLKKNK